MSKSSTKRALIAVLTTVAMALTALVGAAVPAQAAQVNVTGSVLTPAGVTEPTSGNAGYLYFRGTDPDHGSFAYSAISQNGTYQVSVEEGEYYVDVSIRVVADGTYTTLEMKRGPFQVTPDTTTLDVNVPAYPVHVNVERTGDDTPQTAPTEMYCTSREERPVLDEWDETGEIDIVWTMVSTSPRVDPTGPGSAPVVGRADCHRHGRPTEVQGRRLRLHGEPGMPPRSSVPARHPTPGTATRSPSTVPDAVDILRAPERSPRVHRGSRNLANARFEGRDPRRLLWIEDEPLDQSNNFLHVDGPPGVYKHQDHPPAG